MAYPQESQKEGPRTAPTDDEDGSDIDLDDDTLYEPEPDLKPEMDSEDDGDISLEDDALYDPDLDNNGETPMKTQVTSASTEAVNCRVAESRRQPAVELLSQHEKAKTEAQINIARSALERAQQELKRKDGELKKKDDEIERLRLREESASIAAPLLSQQHVLRPCDYCGLEDTEEHRLLCAEACDVLYNLLCKDPAREFKSRFLNNTHRGTFEREIRLALLKSVPKAGQGKQARYTFPHWVQNSKWAQNISANGSAIAPQQTAEKSHRGPAGDVGILPTHAGILGAVPGYDGTHSLDAPDAQGALAGLPDTRRVGSRAKQQHTQVLFVKHVPPELTQVELESLIQEFGGTIISILTMRGKKSALVEMSSIEEAKAVLNAYKKSTGKLVVCGSHHKKLASGHPPISSGSSTTKPRGRTSTGSSRPTTKRSRSPESTAPTAATKGSQIVDSDSPPRADGTLSTSDLAVRQENAVMRDELEKIRKQLTEAQQQQQQQQQQPLNSHCSELPLQPPSRQHQQIVPTESVMTSSNGTDTNGYKVTLRNTQPLPTSAQSSSCTSADIPARQPLPPPPPPPPFHQMSHAQHHQNQHVQLFVRSNHLSTASTPASYVGHSHTPHHHESFHGPSGVGLPAVGEVTTAVASQPQLPPQAPTLPPPQPPAATHSVATAPSSFAYSVVSLIGVVGNASQFTPKAELLERWVASGATDVAAREDTWRKAVTSGYLIEVAYGGQMCANLGPAAFELF